MFAWNIVWSLIGVIATSRYNLLYLKSILAMMEVSCDHRLGCWQSAATAQVFFHPCDTILHFTIESPFFGTNHWDRSGGRSDPPMVSMPFGNFQEIGEIFFTSITSHLVDFDLLLLECVTIFPCLNSNCIKCELVQSDHK